MRILANIFGRSPFSLLQNHMEKVTVCISKLPELLEAFSKNDTKLVAELSKEVSKLEHHADITKNDIRNHLSTSLFLPIARESLLEILGLQDSIADKAEDIGVLLTFRSVEMPENFAKEMRIFLEKNIECFETTHKIVQELDELLEFSFGGVEADKVRSLVEQVAFQEHEVDIIQRKVL
ncbi:MAG: TIGR00153 family protein, partial [Chlamydiales bacterium]|nr:TIGR00153 family protein [Chlamydiales bacterium]